MTYMKYEQRIEWIDGLKGLSALVVVLHHLYLTFRPIIPTELLIFRWPLSELSNGGLAVSVFIILSAIIMTIKCQNINMWSEILTKRYFRLVIPICPIIILYAILWYAGLLYNGQLAEQLNNNWLFSVPPTTIKTLIKSILTSPWGGGNEYISVLWMMKYVFFAPFIVIILHICINDLPKSKQVLILVGCILISYLTDTYWINVFYGYILAKFILSKRIPKSWLVSIICMALFFIFDKFSFIKDLYTLKAVALVTSIALCATIKNILSMRFLAVLGHISFDIYLTHMLWIYTIASWMYINFAQFPYSILIIFIGVLLIVVVFAIIWNKFINLPLRRFTNKIVHYIVNR